MVERRSGLCRRGSGIGRPSLRAVSIHCISAAPAALDRYLAALPAMSLIPVAPFLYDDFCVCDCVGLSLAAGHAAGEFGNFDNETVVVLAPVNNQFVARCHSMSILCGAFFQFFTNPIWIAPQIEYSENLGLIAVFSIVDSERETARQHALEFEMQRMNSAKQPEAFDIG